MIRHRLRDSRERDRRDSGYWFGLSIVLHALLLAAVVFLTPVREALLQADEMLKEPEPALSSDELEKLDEHIQDKAEEQIKRALEEQDRILAELEQIESAKREAFEKFEDDAAEDADKRAMAAIERAIEAMQQAEKKLAEDPRSEEAADLQVKAQDHQAEAMDQMRLSRIDTRDAQTKQAEANKRQSEAADAVQRARADEGEREQLEARRGHLSRQIEFRKQRIATVTRLMDSHHERMKQKQAEVKKAKKDNAEANVRMLEKQVEHHKKEVADRREKLRELAEQIEEETKEKASIEAKLAKLQGDDTKRSDAVKLQAKALQAQRAAAAALKRDVAKGRLAERKPHDTEARDATAEARDAADKRSEAKTVASLYEAARAREAKTANTYKDIKAMEVAMIRGTSLETARKAVDVAKPNRPDLELEVLQREARTKAQLDRHKAEVIKALREAQSMVAMSRLLLEQAKQQQAKAEQGREMALARDEDYIKTEREKLHRAAHAGSGRVADMTRTKVDGEGDVEQPPQIDKNVRPPAFQRVADVGNASGWVAIRSWYIIGPYDNRGRVNRDRVFLPETVVDLGAVYAGEGKSGRDLRWKYYICTSPNGECVPDSAEPYAIYYAYREIMCDKPIDLWCAMGSDDKGKVWVNDELIWISADHHKDWQPGEALRKVSFKQGRNRILFRVENGHHEMSFSFMVHMGSGAEFEQ